MDWYYGKDGKPQGPVDGKVIQNLIATGQLAPDTLVWNQGMGDKWTPVSEVPEFSPPPPEPVTADVSAPAEEKPRLRFAKGYEKPPVVEDQPVQEEEPQKKIRRRLFFGYSCPDCGARVHRSLDEGDMHFAGLAGALFFSAFRSFECNRCGEVKRREFCIWDRFRMLGGSLCLAVFSIALFVLCIWFLMNKDSFK